MYFKNAKLTLGIVSGLVFGLVATAAPTYALSTQESGDPELLNTVRPLLDPAKYNNVSVGLVDGNTNQIKTAHFGSNDSTEYEIGSISKTFAGNLYAVALEKGEVQHNSKIGSILPIGTGFMFPTGNRTLDELASHRAGLPSFPATPGAQSQVLLYALTGRSVHFTQNDLVSHAQATFYLPGVGTGQYSNMGMALLGQGLAKAANTDYKSLITSRMFAPMGLSQTYIAINQSDVAPEKPRGTRDDGTIAQASAFGSYAPAGSVRSTTTDMTKYLSKLLKNEVPGEDSVTPRWDLGGGTSVGYSWFTDQATGRVSHNGLTAGYGALLTFDKATNQGVIVMADRPRSEIAEDRLTYTILDANL